MALNEIRRMVEREEFGLWLSLGTLWLSLDALRRMRSRWMGG